MGKTGRLTRGLAKAGTALGFFSLAVGGIFSFDHLLPAEVFPVALAGGLLIWTAGGWGWRCAI